MDVEVGKCPDQDLFEFANIRNDLFGIVEREDRIPDELARAVIGDVSTPVDVMDLRPGSGYDQPIGEQIRGVPVAPNREHRGVLEQQQVVVGGPAHDLSFMDGALKVPGL
jgi:hypothetical protein